MGLDTAILLALPVMEVEGAAGAPATSPLDDLAGLSLVLRAALTVQKEGVTRLVLVVEERAEAPPGSPAASSSPAAALRDRRLRASVEVIGAAAELEGLARAGAGLGAAVLVARADRVVDPALYRALLAFDPVAAPARCLAAVATDGGVPVGPFVAAAEFFASLAAARETDLDALLARLLAERAAVAVPVGAAWHARATTAAGRRRAFDALFEACRKPVDGMVSRHLNRHVSIFLSKRLVHTPLTPNHLSVLTFLLALGAALSVARGGYLPMLLGAFLFQWNSILDGVDGELARVRFQHSRLGQWIDTVSDDLSSLAFYAGLVAGVRGEPLARELGCCGVLAMAAIGLTMAQHYVELIRRGSGDFYAIEWKLDAQRGLWGRVTRFFQVLLKKDFFIFFYLVMALLGVLPFALPVALLGHGLAFLAATARNVTRLVSARR